MHTEALLFEKLSGLSQSARWSPIPFKPDGRGALQTFFKDVT